MSIESVRSLPSSSKLNTKQLLSNKLVKYISTLQTVEKIALSAFAFMALAAVFYFSHSCPGVKIAIGAPVMTLALILFAAIFFVK